jgi:hypothetical protein
VLKRRNKGIGHKIYILKKFSDKSFNEGPNYVKNLQAQRYLTIRDPILQSKFHLQIHPFFKIKLSFFIKSSFVRKLHQKICSFTLYYECCQGMYTALWCRVARWFVFEPKIPIWVNFGGSCYGKSWYVLLPFGLFTAIGNILWPFGIFCCNLVYFSSFGYFGLRKIWQPCFGVKSK